MSKIDETEERKHHHTIDNLLAGIRTYADRNSRYGNSYHTFGTLMDALFPNGLTIAGAGQWARLSIVFQIMGKMARYTTFPYQGHQDSIHDVMVYSAMLAELDAKLDGKNIVSPLARSFSEVNTCEHIYNKSGECIICGYSRAVQKGKRRARR